jgi:eukaryotic-like serine/threonine-protein kinase
VIGTTLGGKYKVVKLLGEGGMGAVYLGEQELGSATRRVAIKTLHPEFSRDEKIRARFDREVGTVAELEHPHTIQVYDFGKTDDGQLYIVMEYVEGRDVADILAKEGPLEPGRVAKILDQVAGSLDEAHARGIVHRDLKPENVVLTERAGQKDFVKVLDFGIAKKSGEEEKPGQKLTQQGMVLGTPPYMSPEQFTGKPVDARTDVYALGVMAYEMLTGKLPWTAETAWEWATQHMTVPPAPIESQPNGARVPEATRRSIMRAIEKDPDARFATAGAFANAVAAGDAGLPSEPSPSRAKTEMAMPMAPPAFAATPAAGSPGFATPPGIPPPPPRAESGKGRGLIFAVIGVLAIGSVVAIAVGAKTSTKKEVDFPLGAGDGADAGAVATSTDTPAADTDAAVAQDELDPLDPSHKAVHDTKGGGGAQPSGGGGKTKKPEPQVCREARALKASGNVAWQGLAAQCAAQGGTL